MKTSNKILIIYLSLFALVMITGAFSWRYSKPNTDRLRLNDYSIEKAHTIPEFKYVKINGISNVTFATSDVPQIIVFKDRKNRVNDISYKTMGDTLIISSKSENEYNPLIEIRCKHKFSGIEASNSNISFSAKPDSVFTLILYSTNFNDINGYEMVNDFRVLRIHANDHSNVNIHNYEIKNIEIFLESSHINVNKVHTLSGEMKKQSGINCGGAQDINLTREDGCNLNIY